MKSFHLESKATQFQASIMQRQTDNVVSTLKSFEELLKAATSRDDKFVNTYIFSNSRIKISYIVMDARLDTLYKYFTYLFNNKTNLPLINY